MPIFQSPVQGFHTHYEINGTGSPLVFIHGLGSSVQDWEFQLPYFATSYRVLTYDLRGHGLSDKTLGPYSMQLFAEDLRDLLRGLQISSAHVVGLSLGGAIALQFALDFPAYVKSLTVVNSGPSFAINGRSIEEEITRRVDLVQEKGLEGLAKDLSALIFPKPEDDNLRASMVARWSKNDPASYIEALRTLSGWDVTSRLANIRCPSLILCADKDYSPVAFKEEYAKKMINAHPTLTVIKNAHHMMSLEDPPAFNLALQNFLSTIP